MTHRILLIVMVTWLITAAQPRVAKQSPAPSAASDSAEIDLYPIDQIPANDEQKIPVLDFKNTDIRDVLRAIGMQYNVNIYLEPEVKGAISLYLVDIGVRNAIDFIVRRSRYAYRVRNGVVQVYKYEAPPPPPPPEPPRTFHVSGGLVDIDIKDIAVSEVCRMFADSVHINVVAQGDKSKQITAHLRRLPPEKALKVLFESNGYDVTLSDGVYYVSPQTWGDEAGAGGGSSGRPRRRLGISVGDDGSVSMEVDNASLDHIVRTISTESGISIFIYDKLSGSITAKCERVPIDDALRYLLQNTKFTFWKDRGIYFIGSRDMSQQKTTLVIPLKHIMADEGELSKKLPPNVSKNAVLRYDTEHNAVIVIGSFDVVAETQDFIEKIDKPIPQVLIEALVVDFNVSKIRSFGLSVFTAGPNDSGYYPSEEFLPSLRLEPGKLRTAEILNDVLRVMNIDRVVSLPDNFRASIQALEAADIVKVHSTPQVATINGNAANITIGETRYYKLRKQTVSPSTNAANLVGTDERFEQKKFDTKLEVTPWVMDSGYVMVKIRPEFNIPRAGGGDETPPTIDTRVLESMVRLRDGQTIVLGGQRQTENVVNSRGIPVLSSIPILGWLFSSKTLSKNETQMMIFLTPHVYYGNEGEVSPDDYFGDEINRMLEEHDPDKKRERRAARREARQKERELRKAKRKAEGRRFRWPWEIIRERRAERKKREAEEKTREHDDEPVEEGPAQEPGNRPDEE